MNGWTNYATWRVNLEVFDGLVFHGQTFESISELAFWLQEYAEEIASGCPPRITGSDGHAIAFLRTVDYRQIAARMADGTPTLIKQAA